MMKLFRSQEDELGCLGRCLGALGRLAFTTTVLGKVESHDWVLMRSDVPIIHELLVAARNLECGECF